MITHDEMCTSVASAIRHGLDRNGRTVSQLAEITLLNRRTLWRMMNGHGLPNLYDADQIEGAEAERSELEQQVENMEEALEESSVTAYELRLEFVKATTLKKKHVPDAINYLLSAMGEGETPKIATLSDVLGIQADLDWKEKSKARQEAYSKLLAENPDKALLFMAYAISGDDSNTDYVATSWRNDQFPVFCDNDRLNRLYDFLELLGYQISDEERLLMSGEHPAFAPGNEQQANEPDEDEDDYEEDADD